MGRIEIRELPARPGKAPLVLQRNPANGAASTAVVGRSSGADIQLDLRDWFRPNTVSSELLALRLGSTGASLTSGRRSGVMPVLWRQSEQTGQWLILGSVVHRFDLGPGRYQVVAAGERQDACHIDINVIGVPVPDDTHDPRPPLLGENPSRPEPLLETKWDFLVLIYGLLSRVQCTAISDAAVRAALCAIHEATPFPTEVGKGVVKAFKEQRVKKQLGDDRSVVDYLRNLPYDEINDEIRHHPAIGQVTDLVDGLVLPEHRVLLRRPARY